MALHITKYRLRDGQTDLNDKELSFRFLHIDGRIHILEELRVSWQAAVTELQSHGLERINNVMQPLLDQAQANTDAAAAELASIQAEWAEIVAAWEGIGGTVDAVVIDVDILSAALTTLDGRVGQLESDIALYVPLTAFLAEHDAAGKHTTFSQPIRATEQPALPAQPAAGVGGWDIYDDSGVPVVGVWDGAGNFTELIRGGKLMGGAVNSVQHVSKSLNIGATGDETITLPTAVDPDSAIAEVDGVLIMAGGSLRFGLEITDANTLTIHKNIASGWSNPTQQTFYFKVIDFEEA